MVGGLLVPKPTERTLDGLKKQGALCDIVERFIKDAGPIKFSMVNGKRVGKRTGVRKDLYGFIDIIAMFPDREGIWGIQSCGQAFSEHMKKIKKNAYAPYWVQRGGLELWGWRQLGKKGHKIWTPRIHKFSLMDFL